MDVLQGVFYEPISELQPTHFELKSHQDLNHLKINLLDLVLSQRILRKLGFAKTDIFKQRHNGDAMYSDIYFMEMGTIESKTRKTFPPNPQQRPGDKLNHLLK